MRKRKEIKGIAAGFVSHFISRNNDIDGYWGLGILYRHAARNRTNKVEIDLIAGTMNPKSNSLQSSVGRWHDLIKHMFRKQEFPLTWLVSAHLTVTFDTKFVDESLPKSMRAYRGDPFTCTIELMDDENQKRVITASGRCRKHNRFRESKSARPNRTFIA